MALGVVLAGSNYDCSTRPMEQFDEIRVSSWLQHSTLLA